MTEPIKLNSSDFFYLRLAPVLGARKAKYPGMKVSYKLVHFNGQVGGHEYMVAGPGLKRPVGLEPFALRFSCLDDPEKLADFLWEIASGKLHISCWQYLLGIGAQAEIASGERKGYPSLLGKEHLGGQEAKGAQERLSSAVDEGIAIDKDVKRVAAKRSFDAKYVDAVLSERPHLKEEK